MPLKLNVGISRKVGEANYGSRGANVNLEVELDSGLVGEPEKLHDRIRQLFRLADSSVSEQLNGHATDNGNGQDGRRKSGSARQATKSQIGAIHAIADRKRVDLTALLRQRHQTDRPDDLTISEASQLIDELKGSGNGAGGNR